PVVVPEGGPPDTRPRTASAMIAAVRLRVQDAVHLSRNTSVAITTAIRVINPVSGSIAASSTGTTLPSGSMSGKRAHAGVRRMPARVADAAPNRPAAMPRL